MRLWQWWTLKQVRSVFICLLDSIPIDRNSDEFAEFAFAFEYVIAKFNFNPSVWRLGN